jgi:HAD superfamily hydrolase (TIGR01509 family)
MQKTEAIIFDMDGILIDSEPFWRKAEIAVFETVGLYLTDEQCIQTTGYRFDEVVKFWYRRHPWTGKSIEQVEEEVLDLMEHYIIHDAPLMPGVEELINLFISKGLKIAVASSSALRLIRAMTKKLKNDNVFQVLQSAESEAYGKPHPAVFLSAAAQLGVSPDYCLVIEDSVFGVIAAKAAKMNCVAVPDKAHWGSPKFAIADAMLPNLEAVGEWFEVNFEVAG